MQNDILDRRRSFLGQKTDYEKELLDLYNKDQGRPGSNFSSIFSSQNNVYREIPLMLGDPIISACMAVLMETAFQPSPDNNIITVTSPYEEVVKELNEFHDTFDLDTNILTTGFNLLAYGNLPIQQDYSTDLQFERYHFVPDFKKVTPLVVANRTLGYLFDGKFYDTFEFVYAQLLHYKDLGGPGSQSSLQALMQKEGDSKIQNEFTLAPSYLASAVRPWRNIKIIEDSLLLRRLDTSNYMRIIGVKVGDKVLSKNAVRLLNFYRQIFKKVRKVSYDGNGMASSGMGNEFEVVVPMTDSQGVEVKDIGGQIEVRALKDLELQYKKLFSALKVLPSYVGFCLRGDTKISLLNGREVPIAEMYSERDSYIGKQVYTCAPDGKVSFSRIKNVALTRKNAQFVRVYLDNEKFFDVTPDHRCQLRDGSYLEASKLTPGTSLMPLYRRVYRGYEQFKSNYNESYQFTHVVNGDAPKGHVVHHVDFNKRNNDLDNLRVLTRVAHGQLHGAYTYYRYPELSRKYRFRKDGVYKTEGLMCPVCRQAAVKEAHKAGKALPSQWNHKVVSVEWLSVAEDAYDLEVESVNHNFALSAGVFVHNCDDEPSLAGDSSGTTDRRDERFGRTVKALRLSVFKALKQIDVNYLRSKGYDVTQQDFTWTCVAASTVEDKERQDSFKSAIESLTQSIQALDGAGITYNKDYLVKELFSQALVSSAVDPGKLFSQDPVKQNITSGKNLLAAESLLSIDNLAKAGFIQSADVETFKAKTQSSRLLVSSMPAGVQPKRVLSYTQYLGLGSVLASGHDVDLSDVALARVVEIGRFKNLKNAVLPPSKKIFTSTVIHTADNLSTGTIAPIGDLYLLEDGSVYLNGQDLYDYLYMLDQGVQGIPVERFWKEKL